MAHGRILSLLLQIEKNVMFKAIKSTDVLLNSRNVLRRQLFMSSPVYLAKRKKKRDPVRFKPKPLDKDAKVIPISPNMTVDELAKALEKDTDHVFEALTFVKDGDNYEYVNSVIDDIEVIKGVVKKSGMKWTPAPKRITKEKESKDFVRQEPPLPDSLIKRPPVVTIMGHVDHGKTTLLDSLRKTNVVSTEFGGITQHIGAFSVSLPSKEKITFLDTPGHAAFFAMRARGALLTDIVVLVVAADDGVMQQTIESIKHAQNFKVPLIIAINKTDKPGVDIEKCKRELLSYEVIVEDLGGEVPVVPISALKGTNLIDLCENIVALAEILELKGDPTGFVEGHVVESYTDLHRGKLATVIVERGTLKKGAYLIAGPAWAKVRAMFDERGQLVQAAGPSTPVEVIGWRELPNAGEEIFQVSTEQRLKEIINWRKQQQMEQKKEKDQVFIDQKRFEHQIVYEAELEKRREAGRKRKIWTMKTKETVTSYEGPQLSIVLKGDVDGSLEAIMDTLDTYKSQECRLDFLHYGIGSVTENDVEMAAAFEGIIYGFNVDIPDSVAKLAKAKKVPVNLHKVIYKLFNDLKDRLSEQLPLLTKEEIVGEANILEIFQVTVNKKKHPVAGCLCTKGKLMKNLNFKVLHNDEVIYDGNISSMKHFKHEVDTIKTDFECGISLEDLTIQFQRGDRLICYKEIQEPQSIKWDVGF
ncbi:translation initiation factor IF-2, mitochondrial isoform X1 [Octopus sinensis]|uniref:Translation initiation factor IF-2, mitochondrial n=2 Tax=Octopus sinensis TaxID=2607531 RepID=A0A6P7SXK5_9MOLL|nr:translation initiation factor IF-2, mitochondrial isoform X1 [Octopus sinensis]